jgi:hypothetical protein
MINVVHITENPIAGAPYNLHHALNKYQGDKVRSRHIAYSDRNENRIFPHDIIIDKTSYQALRDVLEAADVIHLHNFWKNQHLFRTYPDLWPIVMRKPRVWQVHTQRDVKWVSMEDGINDKGAKHLVIAQYHPRQYPECQVVPNIIDIFEPKYMPIVRDNTPARVVYSPSRNRAHGWESKGYSETLPVLQRLVDERVCSADLIFNQPHAACMARKAKGDIGIDEIVTGSYHLCSLETLSLGLVTLAGLDDLQINTLKDLTGSAKLPWIITTPDTLEENLRKLISANKDDLKAIQEFSRTWMEMYWHPKVTTEHFVKIYESL